MIDETMTEENKGASILMVDDTPENLTVLRQILTDHGFQVRPALSGKVALKAIEKSLPDLIILDIMMPVMNGYEVCWKLKENEETAEIPVIFISALDETGDKVSALKIGAVDYITKPFQIEEVIARVNTHLTLSRLKKNLARRNKELQDALNEIKTLRGLLSICAHCKQIRDDDGNWQPLESYISENTNADFSHGLCSSCLQKHYPKYANPLEGN